MRVLSADDVRRAVPMPAAIDAVAAAFAQLSGGQATVPLRTRLALPQHEALSLFMPAYLAQNSVLGFKVVSIFPHNQARQGLPSIHAMVALFDGSTGRPVALLDGTYLTALRTGAASGVATREMARPDARILALFGAGEQAPAQVHAVCAVRPIARVWIVNRTHARAAALRILLQSEGIQADIQVAPSAAAALAEADIVCCATRSPTPLFTDADIRPGTHINGIGSYAPDMAEVPAATVARARVVVDQREAAWSEAGDLVLARDAGLIDASHVVAELGQVVAGQVLGRTDAAEITFFKSVGNAVQDMAVAHLARERARLLDLGVDFNL